MAERSTLKGAPDWVLVGMVKRIHGRDGEILIMPLTDREERFAPGSELYLSRKRQDTRERVKVAASRPSDRGPLIKLEGYGTREEADALFGASLFVPAEAITPPQPGSYYPFELGGLDVYSGDERVGIVAGLKESRKANPYLEVDPGGGEPMVLIPFVSQVVLSIDRECERIDIIPGFLG